MNRSQTHLVFAAMTFCFLEEDTLVRNILCQAADISPVTNIN